MPQTGNHHDSGDTWDQSWMFIRRELERISQKQDQIDVKLDIARNDITALKVKAGVWGAIGGFIATASAFILAYLKKG